MKEIVWKTSRGLLVSIIIFFCAGISLAESSWQEIIQQKLIDGDYEEASDTLWRIVESPFDGGDREKVEALLLYATLEQLLGNPESGLAYLKLARNQIDQGEFEKEFSGLYYRFKGMLHYSANSYAAASEYLFASLKIYQRLIGSTNKEILLSQILHLRCESQLGHWLKSGNRLKAIANSGSLNNYPDLFALATFYLAEIYTAIGHYDTAMEWIRLCNQYVSKGNYSLYLTKDIYVLNLPLLILKNPKASLELIDISLNNLTAQVRSVVNNTKGARIRNLKNYQNSAKAALFAFLQNGKGYNFDKAFVLSQLINMSSVSEAYKEGMRKNVQMSEELNSFVQERSQVLREIEEELIKNTNILSRNSRVIKLTNNLSAIEEEIARLDPEYSNPNYKPLFNISQIQQHINSEEVILQYFLLRPGGYTLVEHDAYCLYITNDDAGYVRLPKNSMTIRDGVISVLDSLKFESSKILFAFEDAYSLYETLINPMADYVKEKKQIFLVPDRELKNLPFHVLLDEPVIRLRDYRELSWLLKKYAFITLPSYYGFMAGNQKKSIKSLLAGQISDTKHPGNSIELLKKREEKFKFVGFGNPNIGDQCPIDQDMPDWAYQASSLPETEVELKQIAEILKPGFISNLFFRNRATKSILSRINLKNVDILMFATHGLVSGDIRGLEEPALVLTPENRDLDSDGLLLTSDIAKMEIGAQLVILSACNTAKGYGSGMTDALSGLAQSFFHAGTKNAMVTQWEVESRAAVMLTTLTAQNVISNPGDGFAVSLQKAMIKVMMDRFPAPSYWAPFVIVGI